MLGNDLQTRMCITRKICDTLYRGLQYKKEAIYVSCHWYFDEYVQLILIRRHDMHSNIQVSYKDSVDPSSYQYISCPSGKDSHVFFELHCLIEQASFPYPISTKMPSMKSKNHFIIHSDVLSQQPLSITVHLTSPSTLY